MDRTILGLAELLAPPSPRDESKHHVSSLISTVLGTTFSEDREDWANNIMAFGRIWEEAVMRPMVEQETTAFTPNVTVERDGIIGTLDGIAHNETDSFVWECKTRFRPYHEPEEYSRWMYQVKAYCYMTGIHKAWLTVLHVSGRPPNTQLVWHELSFTPEELQENWQMLLNARDYDPT